MTVTLNPTADTKVAGMTALQHRQAAEECRIREEESWQRSDTDGFVSQWCNSLGAREHQMNAEIAEAGGVALFQGLYCGERRVLAKQVSRPCFGAPWKKEHVWLLHPDEERVFGRRYIPVTYAGKTSRVQKALNICQRSEKAPAIAKVMGGGTGMDGLASCFVGVKRIGDEWGADAVLVKKDSL
jgi:hypothetical protein